MCIREGTNMEYSSSENMFFLTIVHNSDAKTKAKYFAPYQMHLSTDQIYNFDYDLSTFLVNQCGFGVFYTDLFTKAQLFSFGLKNIDFRCNHYVRNDGLITNIGTIDFKFVLQ